MKVDELILNVEQEIEIKAAIGDVYKSVLHRFGEGNQNPDGQSMQLILEPWPGGRWFRDRGNGIGHLWGHVQVLKPPVLIELSGPLFMSYPALNHVEAKLEEIAGGTRVKLRHRAIGMIEPDVREGVGMGWGHFMDLVRKDFA